MLVTRELHKYYKECEELGIEIDEHQKKAHMRLQQRLSDRKSNRDAVTEHKAVVAALQAHTDGTNPRIKNVGDALAHDMDWRTAVKNKTSLLDLASPTFAGSVSTQRNQKTPALPVKFFLLSLSSSTDQQY